MFEKDAGNERYMRDTFTLEEEIYKNYIEMRKAVSKVENYKYATEDSMKDSKAFKEGFIAGVKVMSTFFMDM